MLQGFLPSSNPLIDIFAILLKVDAPEAGVERTVPPSTTPEGSGDRCLSDPENGRLRMIGNLGTLGDGSYIGYILHPDFWGKGYMSEAMDALFGKSGAGGLFWRLPG